jgi:hypothetical protein
MVQTKDFDIEFNDFISKMDRPPTESTLKSYKSQYVTIRANFDKPIKQVPNKDLLSFIDNSKTKGGKETTVNTKKNLLNIMVMIKKQVSEEEYKELYAAREKLRGDVDTQIKDKHEKLDIDNMVKYDDLLKYLSVQSNTGYIINYLLIHYCVRNRDLDLIIGEYEDEIPDSGNHLLIDGDKVIYVRNDYKTYTTHGKLVFNIAHKLFVKTVKQMYKKGETKLLKTKTIDKEVRAYTMQGLSETEIAKIVVHHFLMSNKYSEIFELSKRRGTSVDTLLQNYNFKYINATEST